MRLSKKYAICLLLSFVLTGIMAMGAAPTDKPDKEPVDKIIFVHYPKENPGNAFGKPDGSAAIGSGTGTLSKSYSYSGIKWANPSVSYYVNPAGSGVNKAVDAINAAMATWDSACTKLAFTYNNTDTTAVAGNQDGKNVISWTTVTYSNAIAVTYIWYYRYNKAIVEVDTLMNSDLPWSYTAPTYPSDYVVDLSAPAKSDANRYKDPTNLNVPNKYDIRDIMTHEAGHWLMLGDLYNTTKDSELTMYGYGSLAELKKDTLGYGDELGVEAVYGW